MWQPEQPPNQTVAKRIFVFQSLIRRDPLFFLARGDDKFKFAAVAFHFAHRRAFVEQCAGRTGLDAFAALRAGIRFAPRHVEVGDDSRFAAASGDVFRSGSFDVPADAHAAGAKHAAIVIHAEQRVRVVHAPFREGVFVADMIHALAAGERLEFAMTVGHAHGADVIPFGEQQFQNQAAIFAKALAVGLDIHAFGDFRSAGGKKLRHTRNLYEAKAARAHVIDTIEVTQRWDFHAGFFRRLQNGRAFFGADLFAVNRQCFCGHKFFLLLRRRRLFGCFTIPARTELIRLQQCFVFVAEKSQRAQRRIRRGLAEAAEAGVLDHVAKFFQFREVARSSFAVRNFVEEVVHLHRARAAGDALAAGFIHAEFHEEARDLHHVRAVVHHDHAARTHDRAELAERFVIHRRVEMLRWNAAARWPARLHGFDLAAVRRATAHFFNDDAQRRAHWNFDQAGVFNFAGERENFCAFAFLRADAREPFRAVAINRRHVREGLDVVDERRAAEQTALRREWWTRPRRAALSFDRRHERGFFAANKRARADA